MSSGDRVTFLTEWLADLQAQRAKLDAKIALIEEELGQPPGQSAPPVIGTGGGRAQDIPPDAFFKMSIADAAKKYLGMVKRKLTTREIADGLKQGGFHTTSARFENTVYTSLVREANQDGSELVWLKSDGWGLRDWFRGLRIEKPGRGVPKEPTAERDHVATRPKASRVRTRTRSKPERSGGPVKAANGGEPPALSAGELVTTDEEAV